MRLLKMLWWGLVILLIVLLNGTAQAQLPARVYVPLALPHVAIKLGVGGATPAQAYQIGARWVYDWGTHPPYNDLMPVEGVPMLWGLAQAGQPVGGNSQYLMWFNEPDLGNQANLQPEQAARLFVQHYASYPGKLHVAPAPSDGGMWWLVRFHDEVVRLTGGAFPFRALAFHCYRWSAAPCIQVGQEYLYWAERWNVPEVWCTEFSFVQQWTANPEHEARTFVAWLEAQPQITRYAPFVAHVERGVWYWPDTRPAADPSLFSGPESTVLTAVGRWYQPQ